MTDDALTKGIEIAAEFEKEASTAGIRLPRVLVMKLAIRINAAFAPPETKDKGLWGSHWRHKTRGTTVRITGWATLENPARPDARSDVVIVTYADEQTQSLWALPWGEFLDGRFEQLPGSARDLLPESAMSENTKAMLAVGGWPPADLTKVDLMKVAKVLTADKRMWGAMVLPQVIAECLRDAIATATGGGNG